MTYMVRAGYHPQAAITLQETFVRLSQGKNPNWLEGLFASHPPSPERVEANRKTAQALGNSGRMGAEEYQARIAHLKKTKPAYDAYEKGQQALKEKKTDEALKLANQAIEIEPREALFYSLQGEAWKAKGDKDKAEESFSKAVEYNPKYFLPYLQRGLTRAEQGNNPAAEADLSASARLLPTAPAYLGLGTLAQAAGNDQQAIAYYREAGGSQTASGRQAAVKLARLDLARHPDAYLKTRASLSSAGSVIVHISNQAAVAVKNVGFSASFVNAGGATVAKRSFDVDAVIGAGKTHSVDTGLKPPPNTTLRILITAAAVAD
jgi:tetratricopeptide (TPR) repeat protein